MSSIRAPRRPRRANSARAAAMSASLAWGSAWRDICQLEMTGGSEKILSRKRFEADRMQVRAVTSDSGHGPRPLALRHRRSHPAQSGIGRSGMGRGAVSLLAIALLGAACVDKK